MSAAARDPERGDERAPPGVRGAAAVRWAMIALLAAAAAGGWWRWATAAGSPGPAAARGAMFQCPMHPAVAQATPGTCPICKMDLVAALHAHGDAAAAEARGAVDIEPDRARRAGIRTAVASRARVAPRVRAAGYVVADRARTAVVTARSTGWVKDVRAAQVGQRVAKGEVLATVYSPEIVTAQQAYLNALAWAGRGGGRPDEDGRRRLELLGVAAVDVAAIARSGQPRLAVPVRAPIGGYVTTTAALAGAPVQAGSELFQVDDLSAVWVEAALAERDARRVRVGAAARVSVAGEEVEARVQLVAPSVDEETRTVKARLAVANPGLRLRPGAQGDVTIEAASAEGVAVPRDALLDTGEEQHVFVARGGGRFERRAVRPGLADRERVIVLDGVAEGEAVVTAAAFLVDAESRLRAAAGSAAPPVDGAQAMATGAAR